MPHPALALAFVLAFASVELPAAHDRVDHATRADPGPNTRPAAHDLHRVTADMAIEGRLLAGRLRFFKHELERALGPSMDADAVSLTPGPGADALVLHYVRDHLRIEAHGVVLEPTLIESGEDDLDRHRTWWVVVRYEAPAPIEHLDVRNTLLFEVFDDQRNVMKFVRFPEESQETVYFEAGEAEHRIGA